MIRLLALLLSLLLAATCEAMTPQARPIVIMGSQSWIKPGSALAMNFARNAGSYAINGRPVTFNQIISFAKADGNGLVPWRDGHYSSFGINQPRITDFGLLIEPAITNQLLWSRDWTQTAWVKTNITAALNATGIDGQPNSATTLTATANNGTALQTLTIASMAENGTFLIKRVSGSGAVSITENNSSFTTLSSANCVNAANVGTAPNSTGFVRCRAETVLANPIFGLKMATNGDVIIVDAGQVEEAVVSSSPIITTSATVARAADNANFIRQANTIADTAHASFVQTFACNAIGGNANMYEIGDGSGSVEGVRYTNQNDSFNFYAGAGAVGVLGSSTTTAGVVKSAFSFGKAGITAISNGGAQGTQTNIPTAVFFPVYIGRRGTDGTRNINGFIQEIDFSFTYSNYDRWSTFP